MKSLFMYIGLRTYKGKFKVMRMLCVIELIIILGLLFNNNYFN